jgi:hypothetical protein
MIDCAGVLLDLGSCGATLGSSSLPIRTSAMALKIKTLQNHFEN